MTGNFLAVKQDDRNVLAVTGQQFWTLRNVDFLKFEIGLRAAARDDILGPVAQVAIWLRVDGDAVHPRGFLRAFFPTCEIFLLLSRQLVDLDAHRFELQCRDVLVDVAWHGVNLVL